MKIQELNSSSFPRRKLLALRIGSFKAQLGSEAQTVFRVLFVSLSPGDFPVSVDFILRPLPCVRKMAVAAPGYILIAHDL